MSSWIWFFCTLKRPDRDTRVFYLNEKEPVEYATTIIAGYKYILFLRNIGAYFNICDHKQNAKQGWHPRELIQRRGGNNLPYGWSGLSFRCGLTDFQRSMEPSAVYRLIRKNALEPSKVLMSTTEDRVKDINVAFDSTGAFRTISRELSRDFTSSMFTISGPRNRC